MAMKNILFIISLIVFLTGHSPAQTFDWSDVETLFNRKGTVNGDVFKITFPRTDLKVMVGDLVLEPGLALTSWMAFKPMDSSAMAMGDLVLLEKEVAPVTKKLIANGFEITALHNHILHETPRVMYMHFSGNGNAVKLAEGMKSALSETGTPLTLSTLPSSQTKQITLIDWANIETILGKNGQHKGNISQFGFPRSETITENGMEISPFMGMATAINFQKAGTQMATTGDFVLLADEVNPVLKTLTENGIAVTAIHSHMLNETPRLFFMHFWGIGDPEKLARGIKAALDKTNYGKN